MSRLNWNQRHGPDEFDDTAPTTISYEFDLRRGSKPGQPSWPEKVNGQKFGPSFIRKAWAAGLVVYAEIEGWPYPVAVKEAQWSGQVLTVVTLEGVKIPDHLFTRPNAKNMTSSGLLIEGEGK